ncbi:MAG: hypothetical protein HOQ36_20495 [Nocardia sp.]|nr:hypothetical protein [Nocardia sp.]
MSPDGTKRLGDLNKLPDCAPPGLIALVGAAEGVIQEQVELLGSGKPSKAPDLRKLLREQGIEKPEDQSTMLEEYDKHKTEVEKVKSTYTSKDDGIVVKTAGIGEIVTDAYDAIDTSVGELNDKIDATWTAHTWKDEKGEVHHRVAQHLVDKVFTGVWDTLDTTYKQVHGVSDQAAAAAIVITGDDPTVDPMRGTGGVQPVSYNGGSGYSGSTPWSSNSTQIASAPVSGADELKRAREMMDYLINRYGFTPEQAAGIIGNAQVEAPGFDLGAVGDGGSAHGLFQWRHGRWAAFQEFASKPDPNQDPNLPPRSMDNWRTHLDYMVQELRGGSSYQEAENLINSNSGDAAQVARAFDARYEISSGEHREKRVGYANQYLENWRANQTISA